MHRKPRTEGPKMGRSVRTVRFRISLLLLLSALNGVAMVALAIALVASLSEGPNLGTLSFLSDAGKYLVDVHDEMLHPQPESPPTEELLADFGEIRDQLVELGPPGAEAVSALDNWRAAIVAWDAAGRPAAGTLFSQLQEAERRAINALLLVVPTAERATVDQTVQLLPFAMGWATLAALITVWMSLSIRSLVSRPLERLASAAARVSRGDLEAPIPEIGGSPEIEELCEAMESMRQSLSSSILSLDEQNTEMKTMLNALSDGVLFLDPEGRVLEFNPGARHILDGIPATGALLAEGVRLREAFPQLPMHLFEQATHQEVHLPIALPNQPVHHLAVRVFPVTREGKDVRKAYVAVVRDITEAMEVEAIKHEFLSVVTHELKTPLTAIDGFVRLLLMDKAGPLNDKQRKALETVRDQSTALRQMVQDLLDTSRLESGNLPMELGDHELYPMLEETLTSFRPGAEARGLTLSGDLDEARGLHIRCDPFRLKQVIGNLIGNAFKFTPSGGVRIRASRAGADAVISVIDTGRGIPPESIPRLFRKFYQVEQGDTRNSGGAGLGLYICSQLMTAMGGSISVQSTVQMGSSFNLRFPLVGPESGP